VSGVVPHCFVAAFKDVGGAETSLKCVKGGRDDGLAGAAYEACREGYGWGRGRVDAFGLIGGGFVEGGEGVQIGCIEDGADTISILVRMSLCGREAAYQVLAISGGSTCFGIKPHPSVRIACARTAGVVILHDHFASATICGFIALA